MRRLFGRLRTLVKWTSVIGVAALVILCLPVGYIELACRGRATPQAYTPAIEPAQQRREANTYLTYPEWHIVYAYDGLAETLKRGDEYAFDYASSVAGFWRSSCALMRVADAHGGADWSTRSMIHTIGVSFTAEMALKAAYEETFGRITAWWRGANKTPQDAAIAKTADDYATFLRQTPWYRYPFRRAVGELWAAPVDGFVRSWERRISIGVEFTAKRVYARAIAAAAASDPAPLRIRSIVAGLDRTALSRIPDVSVIGEHGGGIEIETPRYDLFTRILVAIAGQGGTIAEIAGNDDIMVTVTVPSGNDGRVAFGTVLTRMKRSGFPGDRLIVDLKVRDLTSFLNTYRLGDPGLEHVFDY